MKILKDNKEVKDAEVIYTAFGTVDTIRIKGVHYDPSAFELVEEKEVIKTKGSQEKPTKPAAEKVAKKSK